MKTLSPKQLQTLGTLSNTAFKYLCSIGATAGLEYDTWRHTFTADVCNGVASWRALGQRDYIPLVNALRAVTGQAPVKDNTPKDDAASLIATIRDRVRHWEAPAAYVARIVADKTGRPWVTAKTPLDMALAGLEPIQLKHVLWTLQRACRRKLKRDCDRMGIDAPPEVHISRSTVPPPRLAAWRGDVVPDDAPKAAKPRSRTRKGQAPATSRP